MESEIAKLILENQAVIMRALIELVGYNQNIGASDCQVLAELQRQRIAANTAAEEYAKGREGK